MSLSAFLSETLHYRQLIQEAEPGFAKAYYAFAGGKEIWSDQCRRIASDVDMLREPVEAFCNLLMDTSQLPSSVMPYRYLPLATLHHMNEQIKTLRPLIPLFRASPRQREKLHRQIERKLELLLQDCQELQRYTWELADQSRFGEHQCSDLLHEVHLPEKQERLHKEL